MGKKGSGSCSSGKSGVFGGKYKKVLKLIIIENDLEIKEIPESSILRHLLNKDTLKFIQQLEYNHRLMRNDEDKRNDEFLANNVDKTAEITEVEFYKNKMGPIPDIGGKVHHKFMVFKTNSESGEFWWSIEKNTEYFVMQRSNVKEQVIDKIGGKPRNPVERTDDKQQPGKGTIYDLLQIALVYGIIGEKYHLLKSNCQQLVEFFSKQITAKKYESRGAIRYSAPPLANGVIPYHFDLANNFEFSEWDPIHALIYIDQPELLETAIQKEVYDINGIYRGVTPLNFAIAFSRIKTVEYLLNKMKADPTKSDRMERTPIQIAALYNSKGPEIIELLLKTNQVTVNDQDETLGNTALHLAAYTTNVKSARYLLEKGANPNAINKEGQTPLHLIAFEKAGKINDIIKLLLKVKYKVNINQGDKSEMTPLYYAVYQSNVQVVRQLLQNGADPKAPDNFGRSPFDIVATFGNNVELIDVLLANKNVSVNDRNKKTGDTALHCAAMNSNALTASYLLKKDANPDLMNNFQLTALHKAASSAENTEIIDVLLNKVNVDQRGVKNWTLLHFAVAASNILATRHLLEKGADPNALTDRNDTPLHAAALTSENTEIVDLLLITNMVNINSTNKSGLTPLHYAITRSIVKTVEKSNLEMVCHLLEKGADPRARNDVGVSPLDLAATIGKDVKLIDVLLENKNVSVDDRDEISGDTALHRAAMNSNALTASHLLKKGANPNAINNFQRTALHIASMEAENTEIFDVLLNIGKLDTNARDIDGKTPLDYVKNNSYINRSEVIRLLERGANSN